MPDGIQETSEAVQPCGGPHVQIGLLPCGWRESRMTKDQICMKSVEELQQMHPQYTTASGQSGCNVT